MTLTIEKTFRFDAGHRALGFPDQKERTLHGHTWRMRVVVAASRELDGYKTIFDTNELNRVVKPLVNRLDHSFIVWSEDPLCQGLVAMAEAEDFADRLIVVDFNPTLEGLAEYLFKAIKAKLSLSGAELRRVDLDAATTLRASYSEE